MNMFLLSSLPNMIIDSVSHWVGSRWVAGWVVGIWLVGGLVVRIFNETQEKSCLDWWFRLCNLIELYFVFLFLFVYLFIFLYWWLKKILWLPETVSWILCYSKKYISIVTEQSLLEFHQIFILFDRKLPQVFLKSICLVKEFFLVNSFIGVSWEILWQVSQQFPRKVPLIFGICFIILSIFYCYLAVY